MERAVQNLGDWFAELRDPRGPNAKRHDLPEIMTIALCAVLAGGQTAVDMAVFAEAKQEFLGSFLRLKNGVPSHDTFSRVSANLIRINSAFVFSGSWLGSARPAAGLSRLTERYCGRRWDRVGPEPRFIWLAPGAALEPAAAMADAGQRL